MADISKIKLPDGVEYNIKDTTARSNSGVTGVKGNSESSYRTGNVNLTAANVGAYQKGVTTKHRDTSNPSSAPQYAVLANDKSGLEYPFFKPIAGIGDWFYALHLNPDYTITCNYEGVRAGTTSYYFRAAALFNPAGNSTCLLDVDAIAETPFVLEITKNSGVITATDVVHLELWGHTITGTSAMLSDYKVELLTTGSTASSGTFSWQTVYERNGVSDNIDGLSIYLNNTSYSYLYFKGLRFTISGGIPGSTTQGAWNYNCIDLTLFRLMDQRPAFSVARAAGALDICGGDVYGVANFKGGLTGTLSGNATTATTLATPRTIQTNLASTSSASFNGSANITPGVTGTLPIANGGTGQTTAVNAANAFANALTTGSADPQDADYYISQYAGGGTSTTTYHRRPHSALWNYIKSKISSILGLTATNYGGTSAKATADASGNTITTYYAPKSTAVTNVALATNKITKTINGTTTDVVTAATTSAYGITKLNSATNSTSTTEAATPSAVKTAYDLATTANGTANSALSGVTGTLIYDHTYTISNGTATFTAHVYCQGEEVTSNYADSCFSWSYRLDSNVTSTPSTVSLGTGKTKAITVSTLGYGGHVIGTFTPPS